VAGPGIADLLFVVLDQALDASQVLIAEAVVPRQLDLGIEPELCLAVG